MPDKNQTQSIQLSFTMQAVLLLLVVIIGLQAWYMLGLKKQLDAIQTEHVRVQPSAQQATENNVDATATVNRPINRPVIAENRTVAVQQDQAAQKIPPGNSNTASAVPPAIRPAWPNNRRFNSSPYDAPTRNPYEDLRDMQSHMERTFDNRQNTHKRPDFQYHFSQDISVPEMDVREDNRQYIVLVNIPGADARNLSVKLEGQRLTVRGKQMQQNQGSDASGRITFSERRSGSFRRGITLHAAVEEKGMKTRIDNGVLTLIIPKKK